MERIFFPLIALAIVAAVVFVREGQPDPIPVREAHGGPPDDVRRVDLPALRVNMAGVIPVIFAAAVLAFPPTMAQYFPATRTSSPTYSSPATGSTC